MPKSPYLSVVIPVYNEADNLKTQKLPQIYKYLSAMDFPWEMILVNDGSSDDSLTLLNEFVKDHPAVKLIDNPHQGKATTVATGVFASQGEYILFSDTDQATPIEELNKFIPFMHQGYEIIIGSRTGRKGAPLFRQILARGMVIFRTLLLNLPITDSQCGFKAFKKEAATKIFTIMSRVHPPQVISGPAVNPGFDVELLYLGRKLGFKIKEIPVVWNYYTSKRVSFFKDAVNGVKELFLVRYRSLTNAYILDADGK